MDALILTAATLGKIVLILVPLILSVAYLTYAERRVIGAMQNRIGPNRVGFAGLLQPFADVFKLLFKEVIVPTNASRFLFLTAPVLTLAPAFAAWAVIPFFDGGTLADVNAGLLYVLAMTSIGVYGVIIAGWASNSKYAFLGAMRSAAQIVAYEIAMGFALIGVLMLAGSLNLNEIVLAQAGGILYWYWIPLFPLFVVYFISGVAETNRAPFDVAEGESEIVAGFHVDYSGFAFALFFLAEYANMIMIAALTSHLLPGRLDEPDRRRRRRRVVVRRQDRAGAVLLPVAARDLPALPLRPDHAPGLEGVHPRHDRVDRGGRLRRVVRGRAVVPAARLTQTSIRFR